MSQDSRRNQFRLVERFGLSTLYDSVLVQDAAALVTSAPDLRGDLVICGDVIEHLPKSKGVDLVESCHRNSLFLCRSDWCNLVASRAAETTPMIATAKLETTGHRQMLCLPHGFELTADEVWVRKDEASGEITLTPKAPAADEARLAALFALLDESPLPDDFLSERQNLVETLRNPLEGWEE